MYLHCHSTFLIKVTLLLLKATPLVIPQTPLNASEAIQGSVSHLRTLKVLELE